MKGFPSDVDMSLVSSTARPSDFPEHPGTVAIYQGDRLMETEKASEVPDTIKYVYKRDSTGKLVSRTPVVKCVGWFYAADGSEAPAGTPAETSTIISYDAKGNAVRTEHSRGAYH